MTISNLTSGQFLAWTRSPLGRSLLEAEAAQVAGVLAELYGPVAVHLGPVGFDRFLETSSALTKIYASPERDGDGQPISLTTRFEALPFDTKSVNLVLLSHVLEFSEDPHQILREIDRVLVPEGHLVVLGFNPWSWFGLWRVLRRSGEPPWCGRFYPLARLKDWLSVLGFALVSGRMLYYLPPIHSARVRNRLWFLDQAGDRWWPMLAAVYLLVARKREFGMTPIVPSWKSHQQLAPGLIEPVARNG